MSLRMLDFRCPVCLEEVIDVLMDTDAVKPPFCCGMEMVRFLARPPRVDAMDPFYDPGSGKHFSSFHEADRWAESHGQVNLPIGEKPKVTTPEQKIAANAPRRMEAVQKSYYRLKHGYKDFPDLPTEDSLHREAKS